MIKKLLIILFLIALNTFFGATIELIVQNNGLKLEKVQVVFLNSHDQKFHLNEGVFIAQNLPIKIYTIQIKAPQFKTKIIQISVASVDELVKQTIELELKILQLDTLVLEKVGSHFLGELHDDELIGSKKVEITNLEDLAVNKSTNNAQQIFYRSPLTNIVQTDGAGLQLGIGGRGLDPHRTSNFNTRQNGYDISADALGYPESYYTPPTEAVSEIEVLRGAASLQYGTQFGGVINFKLRNSYDKPLEIRSRQTLGSFGLFNSFNSIGGTRKNGLKYFTFYQRKQGNDYRPNSEFIVNTIHGHLDFPIKSKIVLGFDQTYMGYLAKQPGGLTDQEFFLNPRQSNRSRNWFQVDWYVPAISLTYFPNANMSVNTKIFGLIARRNSVGNLGPVNRKDELGTERDVIRGQFKNIGNETRLIYSYQVLKKNSYLSMGYRVYIAHNRTIQGIGSAGTDPDFQFLNNESINNDFSFPNKNISAFAENLFHITSKWSITPGVRVESINTSSEGFFRTRINNIAGESIKNELINEKLNLPRKFAIAGLGMGYNLIDSTYKVDLYSNFTQNYRSITFSDLRVNNPSLLIDSNLFDERGWNFDLGIKGEKNGVFDFDMSFFILQYNDKIGEILKVVSDPVLIKTTKRFRSNISDARVYGIEFFAEYNLLKLWNKDAKNSLELFTNSALIRSEYINSSELSVEGNKVEYAPELNLKGGLVYKSDRISGTLMTYYTSEQFSDASNAASHPQAFVGIVPSYWLSDISLSYKLKKYLSIESGVNNIFNRQYFTKRATGYPGPGILPASGRNFYLTLEGRF